MIEYMEPSPPPPHSESDGAASVNDYIMTKQFGPQRLKERFRRSGLRLVFGSSPDSTGFLSMTPVEN